MPGPYCGPARNSSQYPSIVVSRDDVCSRSCAAMLTARTIASAGQLVADVEHVHAARRLLEVPEEHALAGERVGEDRAVDGAVQDGEYRVPALVGEQALERGKDAVEELPDRLAAEEALLERDDAAKRMDELLLEPLDGYLRQPPSAQLAQVRPLLDLRLGRNDSCGFEGARQAAREHAVERHAGEEVTRRLGLRATLVVQADVVLLRPASRRARSTTPRRAA